MSGCDSIRGRDSGQGKRRDARGNKKQYAGRLFLRPIRPDDVPKILNFLHHFEYSCTALSSLFVQRSGPEDRFRFSLPARNACFVLELCGNGSGDTCIAGLLSYSSSGLLYYCLPFMEKNDENTRTFNSGFCGETVRNTDELRFLCTEFLENHCAVPPLSSMMGGTQAGAFLESCMSKKNTEARECKLMSLTANPGTFPCDYKDETLKRYRLRRCTRADSDRLFDLMKAYYIEEVLPAGMILNDKDMRLLLSRRLKNQLVFAMENETGEYEAMAATTALGMHYARLGGVYTLPESRRRGLASFLVRQLSTELLRLHYIPVLFVRTANPGAEKMYAACGFSVCGGYRIAYF
ncbi:GNAT family N-acetyltransferase [Treponema sp. HNW]|uniref:GNAT family N-acetyltransferase n=1 Tax=Treponema sp. HNW TaxID=3116654 RepID=UPI003D132BA1